MFKNYRLRDYDFKLIILILALSIIGIITIGSAEPAQQTKQMAGVVAGLVIMIALSFFNYFIFFPHILLDDIVSNLTKYFLSQKKCPMKIRHFYSLFCIPKAYTHAPVQILLQNNENYHIQVLRQSL